MVRVFDTSATIKLICLCKLIHPAIERDEDNHTAFKMLIGEYYEPHQLVFADESHFHRLTLRRRLRVDVALGGEISSSVGRGMLIGLIMQPQTNMLRISRGCLEFCWMVISLLR